MSIEELQQRASDKLEAKSFYEYKKLQEYQLMAEGIIPALVDHEQVLRDLEAQKREVEVYNYLDTILQNEIDLHNILVK